MKINQLILLSLLLVIFFTNGCVDQPKNPSSPYVPQIDLKISPDTSLNAPIDLSNNQTKLIKLTVTKLDDKNTPTSFILKFKSSNPEYLSAIEAESNIKIEEKQTEILTQKGREFPYQFRVLGRKVPGQPESPWKMDIEVLYENTLLKKQTLDIIVK